MNIDSEYIQKKEFHTAFKGYNMEEVDKFLDIIAVEFDRLIKKNKELQDSLDRSNFETTNEEDTSRLVSEVLLSAHKVADEIRKKAEKEAVTLLEEKKNAEEIEINKLVERKKVLDYQLEQTQNAYDGFLKDIKTILGDFSAKVDGLQSGLNKNPEEAAASKNIFTEPGSDKQQIDLMEDSSQEEYKEKDSYPETERNPSVPEQPKDLIELEEDKQIRDFIESTETDEENKDYTERNLHLSDEQITGKRIFDKFEEERIYKEKRNPDIGNPDIIDEFFGDNE